MNGTKRAYFDFYLMGRDEAQDELEDKTIDYPSLATRTVEGESVRDISLEVAKNVCKALYDDGEMMKWRKSSRMLRQAIDAAGGDTSRAYNLYCTGYTDEIASGIELQILETVSEDEDDDEDGETDDGDEDDEGEDE